MIVNERHSQSLAGRLLTALLSLSQNIVLRAVDIYNHVISYIKLSTYHYTMNTLSNDFYWLHHGPIERRELEIVGSGTDRDLSQRGKLVACHFARAIEQALLSQSITSPDIILSSPMKRTRQTAEIIASVNNLDVQVVADLRAQNFGALEGRTIEDIRTDPNLRPYLYENIPSGERFFSQPPDGESQYQTMVRTERLRSILLEGGDTRPLVITHGTVLNHVIGSIIGTGWADRDDINKSHTNQMIVDNGRDTLRTINLGDIK